MFKSRIPQLLKEKGWTATRLQKEANVAWAIALDVSKGGIPKSTKTLEKICKALGCSPADVFHNTQGELK